MTHRGEFRSLEAATRSGPHLLILGPYDVLGPTSGGELRSYHLARQLSSLFRIVYLCFRRQPGAPIERTTLPGLLEPIELWRIPRPRTYTLPKLVRGLLGRTPITLLNYSSPLMRRAIEAVFARYRFDLLHVEGVHMGTYLQRLRSRPDRPRAIVADWHNLESELLDRYWRHERALPRRLYAAQTVPKLRAAERIFLQSADAHLVVSDSDRRALLEIDPQANVCVVENGVDADFFRDRDGGEPRRFRILFVGAMDYSANVDAAVWFTREVWPLVRGRSGLVLTLVGRSPAAAVRALADGSDVQVTGTVPDVRPFYREALLQVVPLRTGAGTRLKILESMAAGVPVVSTALGAEGLRVRPGEHFLLAESPQEFRDGIFRLLDDAELWRRLAESGRELARREYDWSVVCAPMRELYGALAARCRAGEVTQPNRPR
jgi:sugar transferase (PEP-CTERM/EpsH1 system associated)